MSKSHKHPVNRQPTGLQPIRAAPISRTNSLIDQQRRKRLLACSLIPCVALLVTMVWQLADLHKGYDIRQLDSDTYQISVVVDRKKASRLIEYMHKNLLDVCELKDVRLPGGVMTTAKLHYADALNFLQSNQSHAAVTTIWKYSEHYGSHLAESENLLTIYLEYSYQELCEELKKAQQESTREHMMRMDLNLPFGHTGCCALTKKELQDYTRRMHVVGANKILIPFYWSLDGQPSRTYPVQRLL